MDPRFPEPKMRDEFRRELRARLMAEAPAILAPRRGTAWTFLRPALGFGFAAVLLIAGAGTAAAGSLPGDPAFVLKRAVEEIQVSLTFDDVQRVQLLAQLADRRLQDLQQVAEREDRSPAASEEFAQAIARFRAAVDTVQQAAPSEKSDKVQDMVEAAREKHTIVLEAVQQKVESEKARESIERAKAEEDRETKDEKDRKDGQGNRSPRPSPSRSPRPSETPRGSDSPRATPTPRPSESPRPTERTETPRPSQTVRLTPAPPVRTDEPKETSH